MTRIGIAASNGPSTAAGAAIAEAGGNAVDAAVAAAIVSCCTEPGVCSLGGGAWISVAVPRHPPAVIDANVEMPGRGLPRDALERGMWEYGCDYAGGMRTVIGHGTIATPGTLAGLALLHREWGRAPWREVLEPAIEAARNGFPMGASNRHYLEFVHDGLYGWNAPSHRAIHDTDGNLVEVGGTLTIPELADTLDVLASEGVDLLYRGELGAMISEEVRDHDGILTREDLRAYQPVVLAPRTVDLGSWQVHVPPSPSVGGACLAAMLLLMDGAPHGHWTPEDATRLVEVQAHVLRRRATDLDLAGDLRAAADVFVEEAVRDGFAAFGGSASTVQTSAADGDGLAVSITCSSGYGSGVMPEGTGIWMNNALGEYELNRRGIHTLAPGTRLPTNMAPTIARQGPRVIALGSPGADRITTALLQVLAGVANGGMPLADAIRHPRLHVRVAPNADDDAPRGADAPIDVIHEEDLVLPSLEVPTQVFPPTSMAFGGVAAAASGPRGVIAEADPRRDGAATVAGSET